MVGVKGLDSTWLLSGRRRVNYKVVRRSEGCVALPQILSASSVFWQEEVEVIDVDEDDSWVEAKKKNGSCGQMSLKAEKSLTLLEGSERKSS